MNRVSAPRRLAAILVAFALCVAPRASRAEEESAAEVLATRSRVLESSPTDRDARFERSRALSRLGRHEESLADLDLILERHPEDIEAGIARARILGWMSRYSEGEQAVRRVLSASPRDTDALLVLGDLLFWQERREEALETFSEANRLAPEDTRALLRIDRVLATQGRSEEARNASGSLDEPAHSRGIRLDAGLQFDSLDGGRSDWWQGRVILSAPVAETLVLLGGVEQYRRFDQNDTQGTVGAFWNPARDWSIEARVTSGFDAETVARSILGVEVSRRLSERVTARARYRYSQFAGGIDSNELSPALEISPVPELRALARYSLTRITGGRTGHTVSLRFDLLPESRLSPYVFGAYGTEVFAPTTVDQARSRARIMSLGAGVQWLLRGNVGLRAGVEYEDLKDTYRRLGFGSGLFVKY